jgi:hypothetical protein
MLLTTANINNVQHEARLTTKEEKSIGCCHFVEYFLSIAVSQDQRVFSNFGRLGKTAFVIY